MRGQGNHNPCAVLVLSILLCSILLPGTAQAVQFGHLKQIDEPALPEMKCGEPGHEPLFSTNVLSHSRANVFPGESKPTTDIYTMLWWNPGIDCRHFIIEMIGRIYSYGKD